jgi:hypothetical protein
VADRLDSIGEAVLAGHVRQAARGLLAELGAGDGRGYDLGPLPSRRRDPQNLRRDGGPLSRARARTSGGSGSPAAGSRGGPWP